MAYMYWVTTESYSKSRCFFKLSLLKAFPRPPHFFSLDIAPYPSIKPETRLWGASKEVEEQVFPFLKFWIYLFLVGCCCAPGLLDLRWEQAQEHLTTLTRIWGAVASLLWSLEPLCNIQTGQSALPSISANPCRSLHLNSHVSMSWSVQCLDDNTNVVIDILFYQSLLRDALHLCRGKLNQIFLLIAYV